MRNHPLLVDRIAAKAAAELIVDASLGHAGERQARHVQGFEIRRGTRRRTVPVPQAALHAAGMGKFGCLAEAAEARVEGLLERGARLTQWRVIERNAVPGSFRRQALESQRQLRALQANLGLMALIVQI